METTVHKNGNKFLFLSFKLHGQHNSAGSLPVKWQLSQNFGIININLQSYISHSAAKLNFILPTQLISI